MHDVNLMAAWAAVFNLQTIIWVIGGGISNTIRSDVGLNIGQRKAYIARKYAIMGLILSFFYSFVFGTLMAIFSTYLSDVFSCVPEVLAYLNPMMFIGGFQAWFSGIIPSIATVLRLMEKPCTLTLMALFSQLLLFDGITFLCLFKFDMWGGYLMYVWIGTSIVFSVGTVLPILYGDWSFILTNKQVINSTIAGKYSHKNPRALFNIKEVEIS